LSAPKSTTARFRTSALVVALLLLFCVLAVRQAWVKSETYDEPMYMLSGYSYVVTGDLSFNREHPPLAKYLIGLPLLLLDVTLPDDYQVRPGIEFLFYAHQPNADTHWMLFLSRLPGVLLGVVLGLYVFRWASLAFGRRAGLAALLLYVLNPNVLGHAPLASNDFAVTVFCTATLYHLWRWLATGARASLLFCALTLGLAIGSKLTALVVLPVMAAVVLFTALWRRRPALIVQALLGLLAAGGVLWLLYGGEARTLAEARQHPRYIARGTSDVVFKLDVIEDTLQATFGEHTPVPLLSFLKGIDHQFDHKESGHATYWRGVVNKEGAPEFYVVSWLIKNPEGLTLLLGLGLLALARTRRGLAHETLLYAFPLLLFVIFSTGKVQLGFKYILPVVPLFCIAASRALAAAPGGDRPLVSGRELLWGALLVPGVSLGLHAWTGDVGPTRWSHWLPVVLPLAYAGLAWTRPPLGTAAAEGGAPRSAPRHDLTGPALLLVAWAAVSVFARQPDNLMYFNEWVGGPENGWRWSVIGDDWGQDTAGLGRWMEEHGVEHVYYDYYGEGDPEVWGVHSTPTFGDPSRLVPGDWVAVHVTVLMRNAGRYGWLEGQEPVEKIGNTIFLFQPAGGATGG
jgi:4-amino-4-deoxy-L-arabinose transferase-like glycosyltransferase